MRRIYVFTSMTVVLSAGFLLAQSDSDYQGWMKSNAANMGSLNKNIAAKDGAATSADAAKLADTFKQVASYWEAHNAPDAVTFAKNAQSGAEMVGKDASSGDFDKAAADAKAMGRNCGGCHMAHREKTDAGFKIK
jgi:cytochrome c556